MKVLSWENMTRIMKWIDQKTTKSIFMFRCDMPAARLKQVFTSWAREFDASQILLMLMHDFSKSSEG